ncbi:MAG: hypothetical protein CMK71_02485 [Pseudomonadaceae bacterium]|nr:hypothetical protein [Pseudomonadaceae bacterium]
MKSHVADWQARVYCVRIVATNGSAVRFAAYPHDLTMSNAEVYLAGSGFEFSGYSATSTFSSSSIDLEGFMTGAIGLIQLDEISAGTWDNARASLFATTFYAPIEDEEPIGRYIFGKAIPSDEQRYKIEFMALIDALSQSTNETYSAACSNTLFDQHLDGELLSITQSRCTGPRSAPDGPLMADYKVAGTLTAVTDQYYFTDSARGEADDWFAYGQIRFTTGPNVGLKPIQVKAFSSGNIQLFDAMFYLPTVGDQYEMIPGCRKTLDACKNKYGNVINMKAQPHLPTPSQYAQIGRGQ